MANLSTPRRCAIYTRKSSEEGLEQAYNSLAAQRDACAAYIASQKHEGWSGVLKNYDDGGFSGGNLQRPALQELMQDMAKGKIDIIVVYKIDRLTRSLADFAKLTDVLDRNNVSFVAVTQQFNTSTSMGRLTLNVLLSFAQFEREVTGERIRDKIAASKQRGMWMGGHPPLGYDVRNRKLEINEPDAKTVRHIYKRYLELESVRELQSDLAQSGISSKRTVRTVGNVVGGNSFSRGALYTILKNPIYRGLIHHKGNFYSGDHVSIVGEELFQSVQNMLALRGPGEEATIKRASRALLRGILFDTAGEILQPTHCSKGKTKYRYYTSKALLKGDSKTGGFRIPAADIETIVIKQFASKLNDESWINNLALETTGTLQAIATAKILSIKLEQEQLQNTGLLPKLLTKIIVDQHMLKLIVNRQALVNQLSSASSGDTATSIQEKQHADGTPIEIAMQSYLLRSGKQMRLVIGSTANTREPDQRLIQEVIRARRWYAALSSGNITSIASLAKSEKCAASYVSLKISLAFIAPDIFETIIDGTQPAGLTLERLKQACPLPANWVDQRALLLA